MALIKFAVFVLVISLAASLTRPCTAASLEELTRPRPGAHPKNTDDVIWFPDPSAAEHEEKYVPAYLSSNTNSIINASVSADISKIHFYLYTKQNPNIPDELFIGDVEGFRSSHFQADAKLIVMIHGFTGNINHTFPWDTKNQLLTFPTSVEVHNIILVAWPELSASPDYITAVVNGKVVAEVTAELLEFIMDQGQTSLADVHLIGYSLGGQVAGIVGSRFTGRTGLIIPRLTGLDPAKPLFEDVDDADRISADDAEFVDIIHTAAGLLGIVNARGSVDYYPNGGTKQPGCGVDAVGACAHARAPAMFRESMFSSLPFRSCLCEDWEEFNQGDCGCTDTSNMGYWVDKSDRGKFYLHSNSEEPFAQG